ncbi:interferon regulatory factor 6-like isoform X2 [Asterias amurensis]
MLDLDFINDVFGQVNQNESPMETGTSLWLDNALLSPSDSYDIAPTVPVGNPFAMISGIVPEPSFTNQGSLRKDSLLLPTSSTGNTAEVALNSPETRNASRENTPALTLEQLSRKELLIRLRYRSQEVVREHVKNPNGCLVYHNKPSLFDSGEAVPTRVEFPGIAVNVKKRMTDVQFKFTIQILKALENGLYLRCDDMGNVYATRHCQSKVFWWSTEKGPIAEGRMDDFVPYKLERNNEVMVFDNEMFEQRLKHFIVNKPTFRNEPAGLLPNNHISPINPAIYFTFAQPWNPNEGALSYCLASMIVNPVRARMQHCWGNDDQHISFPVSDYRIQISKSLTSQ